MLWLAQFALLIIILPIAYGPLGHYLTLAHGGPDLFVLSVWTFTWLTDRSIALRWAILLGVSMDLLSFLPFGFWTVWLVILTLGIDYLKSRFFEVSSIIEAITALLIASGAMLAIEALISRSFQIEPIIIGLISNGLLGVIIYYVLAMRYRLFARWEGKRL